MSEQKTIQVQTLSNLTPQEASSYLLQMLDLGIQRGTYSRSEIVAINAAMEKLNEGAQTMAAESESDPIPPDPSKPKP